MKKLIVFGALSCALSISAQAADSPQPQDATCASYENLAHQIMHARQFGMPLSKLMTITDRPSLSGIRNVMRAMADEAYNKPRQDTEEAKQR